MDSEAGREYEPGVWNLSEQGHQSHQGNNQYEQCEWTQTLIHHSEVHGKATSVQE